ncbi:MAG TPA: hypothetical protein ENN42_01040 [Thioalkalivibrio sp.]|nr:hypothetical protein [Thioalkalivibrio sp.]
MNIIFCSKGGSAPRSIHFTHWAHFLIPAALVTALGGGMVGLGYYVGVNKAPTERVARWEDELKLQRLQIEEARTLTQANIDVLTQRLGQLQGHVTRLNALGTKLVKMADIDASEFDFGSPPALGGPEEALADASLSAPDLVAAIDQLAAQIQDREQQLQVLDQVILTRAVQQEVYPKGRPIVKGWTSSYYGVRTDPFSGKPSMHKGMDFAGKHGSDVVAVAGGVVTWSGKRWGYGNLVEINHGNGYVTRYAHNSEHLVEVGEAVKKGQAIAKMGTTGRSTGPHVHFEVLQNGKHVDPAKFLN